MNLNPELVRFMAQYMNSVVSGVPPITPDAATSARNTSASPRASASPHSSVDAGSPPQSASPSNVATPTLTPNNPMEQFQALWQMMAAPEAPFMDGGLFPGMQSQGSCVLPITADDPTSATNLSASQPASSASQSRVDNGWPQPFASSSNLSTPTFMNPRETVPSETRSTDKKQKWNIDPVDGNDETMKHFDKRIVSILWKSYIKDPYLNSARKKELADQTGLTSKQLICWFSNRRKRDRAAAVKNKQNGQVIDSANHLGMEATPSEDSDSEDFNSSGMPMNDFASTLNPRPTNCHDKQAQELLRKYYSEEPYLRLETKMDLANQTRLTPKQVENWFKNRRECDRAAAVKKIQNKNFTDAGHNMEATQTGNSLNVDPDQQPKDSSQAFTSKTLPNGNQLDMNTPNQWKPTLFDEGTQSILMQFYLKNPVPSPAERKMLASLTGLKPKQISNWFWKRRPSDSARAKEKQYGNATDAIHR